MHAFPYLRSLSVEGFEASRIDAFFVDAQQLLRTLLDHSQTFSEIFIADIFVRGDSMLSLIRSRPRDVREEFELDSLHPLTIVGGSPYNLRVRRGSKSVYHQLQLWFIVIILYYRWIFYIFLLGGLSRHHVQTDRLELG
jgi:hypothetical protein